MNQYRIQRLESLRNAWISRIRAHRVRLTRGDMSPEEYQLVEEQLRLFKRAAKSCQARLSAAVSSSTRDRKGQHLCKFCRAPIRRKRFENTNAYLSRDYCAKPKCMAKGRELVLAELYAKEKPDPSSRHSMAFVTRTLFVYRWGMEAMEAMDRFGREASEDWERIFRDVQDGKAMQVVTTVRVLDCEDQEIAQVEQLERFHLDAPLGGEAGEAIAREAARGANERIIQILYQE